MPPAPLAWEVGLRLQAVFAVFLGLLLFHALARRPAPGEVRHLVVKLLVYYLVTHVFLVLVALGGVWLRGVLWVVGVLGARELGAALLPQRAEGRAARVLAVGGVAAVLMWAPPSGAEGVVALAALLVSLALPVFRQVPQGAHLHVSAVVLVILTCGLLPLQVLRLREEQGMAALFCYLLVLLNDGFAEASGRLFGRTPWCAALSPRKTREGALGGVAVSLVGAWLFRSLLPGAEPWTWLGLGLLTPMAANLGDLSFSALKRGVGLKDFDSLLPSHGGVLDRFDSLLMAAPLFLLLLRALAG